MSRFHLKIWQIEQTAIFELAWGRGQQLAARVPFPATLLPLYQTWHTTYLSFYTALRASVEMSGSMALPKVDWRSRVVQAEAQLLAEFHYWLHSAELLPLRQTIAAAAATQADGMSTAIDLFLTCDSIELARLPWEAWEIGTEFATQRPIRLVRTPATIRLDATPVSRRGRVRILAILGDDTGLDFQADREAVGSLAHLATLQFMGWQPGQSREALKTEISQALTAEPGWDILFFAGHSNETVLTGGELGIAPGVSILLQEIAPQLAIAKQRGLRFAIFNSCNGLSLAHTLIDLGLSQVAVMREPIPNPVAQEFLVRFLQSLADFHDVHDALLAACQFLKLERNLTYPSAYLIPSLFRHPDSTPFRLQPTRWQDRLQPWLPTRRDAIALPICLLLSLLPLQDALLPPRLWLQAAYRRITHQIPLTSAPVVLVQIDQASLRRQHINARHINPLDRTYLAQLLTRTQSLTPSVVGIDYLLDQPTPEDAALAHSVQAAVRQNVWLVFGSIQDEVAGETGVMPHIASPKATLQGYTDFFPDAVEQLSPQQHCTQICPFSYLLALSAALHPPLPGRTMLPSPAQSRTDWRAQVVTVARLAAQHNPTLAFMQQRLHMRPLSEQTGWLKPLIDYSIPPDQVYTTIPAWKLLDDRFQRDGRVKHPVSHPVVIIAAGYEQAGVVPGADRFSRPIALAVWGKYTSTMSGAEIHAYMVQHWLTQHFVLPIPLLWMMGLAVFVGKGLTVVYPQRQRRKWLMIASLATLMSGWMGLQLFISAEVLFPWLLPSVVVWVYVLPPEEKRHG